MKRLKGLKRLWHNLFSINVGGIELTSIKYFILWRWCFIADAKVTHGYYGPPMETITVSTGVDTVFKGLDIEFDVTVIESDLWLSEPERYIVGPKDSYFVGQLSAFGALTDLKFPLPATIIDAASADDALVNYLNTTNKLYNI